MISTSVMADHSRYTYASSTGYQEIATWSTDENGVIPASVCAQEESGSERYLRCLDGAREIMAYLCLIEGQDYACDGYRGVSKRTDYLAYRREVNSAPFSAEAIAFDAKVKR